MLLEKCLEEIWNYCWKFNKHCHLLPIVECNSRCKLSKCLWYLNHIFLNGQLRLQKFASLSMLSKSIISGCSLLSLLLQILLMFSNQYFRFYSAIRKVLHFLIEFSVIENLIFRFCWKGLDKGNEKKNNFFYNKWNFIMLISCIYEVDFISYVFVNQRCL